MTVAHTQRKEKQNFGLLLFCLFTKLSNLQREDIKKFFSTIIAIIQYHL